MCALFKKFTKEDISNLSQVKSSVARGIRGACYVCVTAMPWQLNGDGPLRLLPVRLSSSVSFLLCFAVQVCDQYPYLEETGAIDYLIPKKEPMFVGKW